MKSVVSEKGQVTIPKPLRDRLGLVPGQILEFEERNGQLIATKVSAQDPVDGVYGIFALDRKTDDLLIELRGEPDLP